MKSPWLLVVAGPNGAGKSTFVDRYLQRHLPIVNPDVIARELNPSLGVDLSPAATHSARLALHRQKELLNGKHSFGVETTLTGQHTLKLINQAKLSGYSVCMIYVGICSWKLSRMRVDTRVEGGGHQVPTADLRRRYQRSLENVCVAANSVDRLMITDNSGAKLRMVYSRRMNRKTFESRDLPAWIQSTLTNQFSMKKSRQR